MKTRIKLSGSPLGYTLALVDDATVPYKSFGSAIWSEELAVPATMKELLFIRTSIVNQCPT